MSENARLQIDLPNPIERYVKLFVDSTKLPTTKAEFAASLLRFYDAMQPGVTKLIDELIKNQMDMLNAGFGPPPFVINAQVTCGHPECAMSVANPAAMCLRNKVG